MKFYTLEEVATQLHMSNGTARNRIARGDPMPPFVKVGRRLLFSEPEFLLWFELLSTSSNSPPLSASENRNSLCEIPKN